MPENIPCPHDPPADRGSASPEALSSPAAPAADASEAPIVTRPVPALPAASAALPSEAWAMLELVGRGLAPDADDSTRGAARDLWARFGQLLTAAPAMPTTPMIPAARAPAAVAPIASTLAPVPGFPGAFVPATPPPVPAMPTSAMAQMVGVLRNMPADQLLELALQRLRAALPAGATVPTPRGIQFQLVPIPSTPIGGR